MQREKNKSNIKYPKEDDYILLKSRYLLFKDNCIYVTRIHLLKSIEDHDQKNSQKSTKND